MHEPAPCANEAAIRPSRRDRSRPSREVAVFPLEPCQLAAVLFISTTRPKELAMSVPREPIPDKPPMPGPGWTPEPPIEEPDPDRLPDEFPVPNPDENEEPPKHA
ncbi:hypothetical protein NXC24_CH00726 [Rhizobium sp. NXC24]|nr:hypothetical protein NXC24_CH00726 [Rhizobium sp. NXC24]